MCPTVMKTMQKFENNVQHNTTSYINHSKVKNKVLHANRISSLFTHCTLNVLIICFFFCLYLVYYRAELPSLSTPLPGLS